MNYVEAFNLAKSGNLNGKHRKAVKKTITWLYAQKYKNMQKYDKQITKWKKIIDK